MVAISSRIGSQAFWGLADQGLSSVTSFALSVAVARGATPHEFGAYALALGTYWAILTVARAAILQPLLIRYADVPKQTWREATTSSVGAVALVALLPATAFVITGSLVTGTSGEMFLAVGTALPSLLLRDGYRYAFFAARRARSAFVNQALWSFLMLASFVVIRAPQGPDTVWIWSGTAGAAAALAVGQARLFPRMSNARAWWRSQRDIAVVYGAESILTTSATQLALYGVGAVAGVAAVGGIRAAEILFGPIQMLAQAVQVAAIPQMRDLLRISVRRLWLGVVSGVVASIVVVLGWGAFVYWLPPNIGTSLLGASWAQAREIVLPVTLGFAAVLVGMVVWTGLAALAAARRSLTASSGGALLSLVGALIGSTLGMSGAAWGLALAGVARAILFWREFHGAIAGAAPPPAAEPLGKTASAREV